MCTGFEIAALLGSGISAVGAGIQNSENEANQRRMAEARNEKLRGTLNKNDELAQDSREEFNKRRQNTTAEALEQDRADATQKRDDTLQQSVAESPAPAANVSLSGSAPEVVKSELAKRMQTAMSDGKAQAKNLSKLSGYGDTWLNQGFADVEAGRGIAQDANFASGNMAILPYQQDIAETRAYEPISPIGGLLQGAGSMLGSFGGGGAVPKKKVAPDPWSGMRKAGYV